MSSVTSVVLVCEGNALSREDMHLLTDPINGNEGHRLGLADDEGKGGGKASGLSVYTAGLNYADLDELERWFRGLPWREYHRSSALLYTLHEYNEMPIIFRLED